MRTQTQLKTQYNLIKFLDQINHPDSIRISKEIIEYTDDPSKIEDIKVRLQKDEPWEYICQRAEFCGSSFKVTPAVLIPRIETEQLVHMASKAASGYFKANPGKTLQIIDVGTGSGAIIISIYKDMVRRNLIKYCSTTATDISDGASNTAKENATNILGPHKISFLTTDLIDAIPESDTPTLLISNPPYIPTGVYNGLDPSVKLYEPRLALDGGPEGTDIYQRLIDKIDQRRLNIVGVLFEITEEVTKPLLDYLQKHTSFSHIQVVLDYRGKERFIYIIK